MGKVDTKNKRMELMNQFESTIISQWSKLGDNDEVSWKHSEPQYLLAYALASSKNKMFRKQIAK